MNQHIYISLLSTAALLVTLIIVASVIMVSTVTTDSYMTLAQQKLERSVTRSKNYVNSVLITAAGVASDAALIAELSAPTGKTFTSLLDNACNYAMKTDAITVYALNGNTWSSSGISNYPSLDELKTNGDLGGFFADNRPTYVSLRTDRIAKLYGSAAYDEELGVISCCRKVYDGETVVGYIVADILPSNVYKYFDWSEDEELSGVIPAIRRKDFAFPYGDNAAYADDFAQARQTKKRTADGAYTIVTGATDFFGGYVSVAVPMLPLYLRIGAVAAILTAVGIAVLVLVHFVAKRTAADVDRRLLKLYGRMEREGYGFKVSSGS